MIAAAKKFLVAASALLPAALVSAHHSFMAEFDQRKPVTGEGSIRGKEPPEKGPHEPTMTRR